MPLPPPPVDIPDEDDPLEAMVKRAQPYLPQDVINTIILNGDLSKLTQDQKSAYYVHRCNQLGLDPATKPFDLLKLQGKEILYANKGCAAQLRALNKISTAVIGEREWAGLLVIRVRAWYPDGRQHEDEGFAQVDGLRGEALGNARLKAMTKATRRAILHLCGLGELDESEVESIPGARPSAIQEARTALAPANVQIPQLPVTGMDFIKIMAAGPLPNGEILVEDENSQQWYFPAELSQVITDNLCKDTVVMVTHKTLADGKHVVESAEV